MAGVLRNTGRIARSSLVQRLVRSTNEPMWRPGNLMKLDLKIALTGATGYVGGMLLGPLSEVAEDIVCITRNPARLEGVLACNARAVQADVRDLESLKHALAGCDVAFYLVHSLSENDDFSKLENQSARVFAEAARDAGIRRIIYLGALAQSDATHTSAHIESRHSVGMILRSTGVPVTEFRASVIIGAGSMPFEVVRSLVERLPVMVTPRWVRMPVQPIAARDLTQYLLASVSETGDESHVYEIGGADVTTYADLMNQYARARKLRRFMIPVPLITPRLSSLWLKLVTPAHYRIGKRIVDSAAHSSIVLDERAKLDFDITPVGVPAAIGDALACENEELRFLDSPFKTKTDVEKVRSGTKIVERRSTSVDAEQSTVDTLLQNVGGKTGWFWGNWLWKLRGAVDRVFGGRGLRANETRYPLAVGSIVDFWTVVRITDSTLVLRADMKLPGEAWLQLSTRRVGGKTIIDQTAAFDPKGVTGILYWFALYPIHVLVFGGMLRGIKKATEHRM
jgi:uncharacterized protein YbjT (DUF2867 family)